MRRRYQARRAALLDALHGHFAGQVVAMGDAAGLHVVARFDVPGMAGRARRAGVRLADTRPFYLGAAPAREFLLRFPLLGERALREAVRRLATA
jgi:DNA-binding transcriptional MocR family regulator